MPVRSGIFIFLLFSFLGTGALARISCTDIGFGKKRCRDSGTGSYVTVETDMAGQTTFRTPDGRRHKIPDSVPKGNGNGQNRNTFFHSHINNGALGRGENGFFDSMERKGSSDFSKQGNEFSDFSQSFPSFGIQKGEGKGAFPLRKEEESRRIIRDAYGNEVMEITDRWGDKTYYDDWNTELFCNQGIGGLYCK